MTDTRVPDNREAAAREICAVLQAAGHRALLAGGCVRDLLLQLQPKDFDIATSARAEEITPLFARCVTVGAAFGVVAVVRPEGVFEVATFRRDGPYLDGRRPAHVEFVDEVEDARRRDFTINALFLDPIGDEVLDYVEGKADLERRVIRCVGSPRERFQEDHLRLLRAVRFAARLDYAIEPATLAAIKELAPLIQGTSAERVRDELLKILTEGGARRGFELLDETGLLAQVLPEVSAMKGVEQPPVYHPEGDVFVHTMIMLGQLPAGVSPTLALGVLLHDVGKPVTQTFEDRIRFNNHDKAGARMAESICQRLRLSRQQTERVVWLVEQHMRLAALPEMRQSKAKRFAREEGFDELVALGRIDALSSHADTSTVDWIQAYKAELKPEEARPEPLLSGGDLIAMGYAPGPLFKKILTALEDAQLEGELTTREEARVFVREKWPPG